MGLDLQHHYNRWCNLSVNFIVRLSEFIGYNAIIVYVDRLIKIRYFISITNEIIAEGTANLFIINIYKLYSFLSIIVSDKGS